MKLAVIPARGGSKRIPRKNIKKFCGSPMISWAIKAVRLSACFDRIIVSTDDLEIAEISRQCGAETPFIRPAELSDDHTGTIPVVAHTIGWCLRNGPEKPDAVCCVYATAPFIRPEDLRQGCETLLRHGCDYTFSATSFPFPIQRALRIKKDGRIEMFHPEHFTTRSQDLEEAYHDAGQFYWGRTQAWLEERPIFNSDAVPILLPRHRVQDIDTIEDWLRAELMFRALRQTKEKT